MQKIPYIHKLEGTLKNAHDCPFCHRQGGSIEHQSFKLSSDKGRLIIETAFCCCYCYESWQQSIEAEIGKVIKNEVGIEG
jgi:hypothetical protein